MQKKTRRELILMYSVRFAVASRKEENQ